MTITKPAAVGFILLTIILTCSPACLANPAQDPQNAISLIVRADDIGSSHTANLACIKAWKEGIARSVEIMVPCPWFNEAVRMLNDNPACDVGVHLTLTSEWSSIKWRPLTHCPSLVDEQGNFFPMVWPNKNFPAGSSLRESNPKIDEIEAELRAQIKLALKKIKNVTHLSSHMGFTGLDPAINDLVQKLAAEYKLPIDILNVKHAPGMGDGKNTSATKEDVLAETLANLTPGLWLLVDHPGLDTPEMQAIGHVGYEDVAADRAAVTKAFTSPKVMKIIADRHINLISYADALRK
jgi:hypothetical protein